MNARRSTLAMPLDDLKKRFEGAYRFDPENYTIQIFGEIDEFWGYGLPQLNFDLQRANGERLTVNINSHGGSIVDGLAIRNALKGYSGEVVTTGIGFVGSIATIILLAGDNVRMANNSFLMIHEPTWFRGGTVKELESQAETLTKLRAEIIGMYVDKIESNGKLIGKSREATETQINEWLERETWFSADEAFNIGLIDEVTEDIEFLSDENIEEFDTLIDSLHSVPQNFSRQIKKFKMVVKDQKTKGEGQSLINRLSELLGVTGSAQTAEPENTATAEELQAARELLESNGLKVEDAETETETTETETDTETTETAKETTNDNTELFNQMREELESLRNERNQLTALIEQAAGAPTVGVADTKTETGKEKKSFGKQHIKALDKMVPYLIRRARQG